MMVPADRVAGGTRGPRPKNKMTGNFFFFYDTMSAMNVPCAWIVSPRSREVVTRCIQDGGMKHPVVSVVF